MYQDSKRTHPAIVLLIEPFVGDTRRRRCSRGLQKLRVRKHTTLGLVLFTT